MNLRSKIITAPTVLFLVAIGLTGCGANAGEKTAAGQAPHETKGKPTVLTIFTVLQGMAKNVAGDHLNVRSITKPGTKTYGYQPTPSGLRSAKDAELILNNDLGSERWFEKFTANLNAKTANVSEGVKPIPIAEGDYESRPNPHAWISLKNDVPYVHNIAKAFCDLDATDCNDYRANADKYTANVEKIGKDINTTLSSLNPKQRTLVSCKDAFSYPTCDYNLNGEYLRGVDAEGTLTPLRVAGVESYVKESKIPAVSCESTMGERMKSIVGSTGVRFSGGLYVDSLFEADGDVPTYLNLLKYDAKLVTDGLTGE